MEISLSQMLTILVTGIFTGIGAGAGTTLGAYMMNRHVIKLYESGIKPRANNPPITK